MASFDEVVLPGQAGTIKASIHTTSYHGAIQKGITVNHDDGTQGSIMLSVKANIVGSVTVFPYPSLTIAPRMKGMKTPAFLLIRKDDSEKGDLVLDDLKASVPWINVSARKVTSPEPAIEGLPATAAGDYVLSVQAEHPPVGGSSQTISFKTGLAREATFSIPVVVSVRAPIVVQPAELVLQPKAESPDSATGQVLASIRDDLDTKKVAVTSDDKAFVARIENPGERAFRVVVDWTKHGKKPALETKLHINAEGETTEVPVRVATPVAGLPSPAAP
ncbi:MAG TPA: hypothetical protein VFV19_13350 [Candidatus Polarisedimenticolaceae bacterium]|nr:hypothetical protein [Candidatus Polarisedimenticolaceae bacterium]